MGAICTTCCSQEEPYKYKHGNKNNKTDKRILLDYDSDQLGQIQGTNEDDETRFNGLILANENGESQANSSRQSESGVNPLALLRKKSYYQPVKGDQLDEEFERVINQLDLDSLPVIRISNGKYLIGSESKMVVLKHRTCMVRVGGGFQKLEEYIITHKEDQIQKIKRMMTEKSKSYEQIILELLIKYGADQTVQDQVQKSLKLLIFNKMLKLRDSLPKETQNIE
ncbi:gas2 domain containing protein [Stylonychia lemnae]|uniref:Gas2 domain containing protein n=1 Tax=Stylonychia lemnae TaxID=5949 RepID=A0A078AP58_STYLE|nr:gas2 domain containing protein [Stylonychia lemnae]|eukprot:CDW82748.1 gas2 domain containing protein [Stylonychia lemnae]